MREAAESENNRRFPDGRHYGGSTRRVATEQGVVEPARAAFKGYRAEECRSARLGDAASRSSYSCSAPAARRRR